MGDRPERNRKQEHGLLAGRLSAIALAAGACLCVWVFGKGNQGIFALPLALWLGVSFWPDSTRRHDESLGHGFLGRWRGTFVIAGIVGSWSAVVAGMRYPVRPPLVHRISAQSRIEGELSRAEQDYGRGKFAEAVQRLDRLKISAELPTLKARLAHDRGIALLRLGNKPAASESLAQSLQYDPRNIEALCLLSEIAFAQGNQLAARSYLDRAFSIDRSYSFAQDLAVRMNAEKRSSRKVATP